MHSCYICQRKVPGPQEIGSPRGDPWEYGRIISAVENATKQFFWACFQCGEHVHLTCAKENKRARGVACPNPYCDAGDQAPRWHRDLYRSGLVAAGLAGFVVMSHVTAAAVGLPQRVVWARERLYFGLPRQSYAAWAGLLVGFPLGSVCLERSWQEWDYRTRQPDKESQIWGAAFLRSLIQQWNLWTGLAEEKPKAVRQHQHPPPIVRPRWRHEWNLVAGSWVAMWTGVITMQILFGKIVASRNGIPMRNLWVLSQRAQLPVVLRHKMEMAVTLGNVFGVGTGLFGYTVLWDGMQSSPGDMAAKRANLFWEVAATMAGLLVASHLFTLFIKEWACTPRRQVWHGFGIAKLFKGDPTFHSRKLALATATLAVPFVFVPAYFVWVGRD